MSRGAGIGGTWSRDPLAGCNRRAGAWSRGPVFGDATAKARIGTRIEAGALGPLPGRTYAPRAQALLRRPRAMTHAADVAALTPR